ncbi:MAG TPA: VOC family protein [Candidatus Binatia bacterium]|jgi:methylmalonyl-CoA/ethylmalonyl-CoA epimerase
MFKIKGVHHLGLPVNNLDRAKKFYTEVLGMQCTKVAEDEETGSLFKEAMGHYPMTARMFMQNGDELVLFERSKAIDRGAFDDGTSHISLELAKEDFTTAVADLKKAGVHILYEEHVRPTGRSVYFLDPEGNYLQIHTPLK